MVISEIREQFQAWLGVLLRFRWLLLACLSIFGLGGLFLALMTPKVYHAHQLFLLRDDLSGDKLQSFEWLKSAQETIQEVAKHPDVLRAALEQVGPESVGLFGVPAGYPSDAALEDFRESVWVSAPGGNEVGKTEVIRLNVKARTRQRALQLVQQISEGMTQQLRLIRQDKATTHEVGKRTAVESAKERLQQITIELIEMERGLGEDLIELRAMLDEKVSSESALLKPLLLTLDSELLKETSLRSQIQQDVKFFQDALDDVSSLLGLPNSLLEQYQSLKELKTSLVTAEIQMADITARYKAPHKRLTEAETRVQTLENQIRRELGVSIEIARARLLFTESQIASLTAQRQNKLDQLTRLAELRAPYQNLVASQLVATNRLKQAQDELAQARATKLAAAETDLLTPLDEPQAGTRNMGSSRSLIVAGSTFCGMLVGVGLMMLFAVPVPTPAANVLAEWQ